MYQKQFVGGCKREGERRSQIKVCDNAFGAFIYFLFYFLKLVIG